VPEAEGIHSLAKTVLEKLFLLFPFLCGAGDSIPFPCNNMILGDSL